MLRYRWLAERRSLFVFLTYPEIKALARRGVPHVCRNYRRCLLAREGGQIIRRSGRTWLVRLYNGRDAETEKREYLNQKVHAGFETLMLSSQDARRMGPWTESRLI